MQDASSVPNVSPARKCVIQFNEEYTRLFAPDSKILEIGCGSWSPIRDRILPTQTWKGIDPVLYDQTGKRTIVTEQGSVEDMPYEDEMFDFVIGNQSLEHWFEFGVPFEVGMAEISRVCKIGGRVFLNVPIHLHGERRFVQGDLYAIRSLFPDAYWKTEYVECAKNPEPQDRYIGWKSGKHPDELIPNAQTNSSWALDIRLTKIRSLPHKRPAHIRSWLLRSNATRELYKVFHFGPRIGMQMLIEKLRDKMRNI